MKIFHAVAKLDAGADKKHDINFHWPYVICCDLHSQKGHTCCKLSILPACQFVKLVNFTSLSICQTCQFPLLVKLVNFIKLQQAF